MRVHRGGHGCRKILLLDLLGDFDCGTIRVIAHLTTLAALRAVDPEDGAIVFALVVSILAALYPASRAARIDPVRALRHD